MIKIVNTDLKYLEDIKNIADNSQFIQPNNHMMYYLCCTIFSNYSFVALKNNEVIGYLFCFTDSQNEYVWIHQISVIENEQGRKIASRLLKTLGDKLIKESRIKKIRFTTRTDNHKVYNKAIEFTKNSFLGINYKVESLGIDKTINTENEMEIFEITV